MSTSEIKWNARLDHPVGINATYAIGRRKKFFKTQRASLWYNKAVLDLRSQGFKRVAPGLYRISISYTLYTVRLDVDAATKATIDVIAEACGFDDTLVAYIEGKKVRVKHYKDQHLDVEVRLVRIKTKDEWNES